MQAHIEVVVARRVVPLAQLGEFSFILAALGIGVGAVSPDHYRLIVAVTVLSLIGSPFWLEVSRRLHRIVLMGVTSGRETVRLAVDEGFEHAMSAIVDSNVSTILTAAFLFQFGTGPVKGFAVTLSIGVVTSVFAALVITRLLFALYPGTRPVESLSI